MNVRIKVLKPFVKEAKRLRKRYASFEGDLAQLFSDLTANPKLGTDLGGGVRKIRMRISSKGKGKSGGARVISMNVFVAADETEVSLLYIYDKSERSTVSAQEIETLLIRNGLK